MKSAECGMRNAELRRRLKEDVRCGLLTPLAVAGEWLFIGCAWIATVFGRFLFWLTTDVVCSWCGQVLHAALWPNQTSHGICRVCLTRMQDGLNHDCVNAGNTAEKTREVK